MILVGTTIGATAGDGDVGAFSAAAPPFTLLLAWILRIFLGGIGDSLTGVGSVAAVEVRKLRRGREDAAGVAGVDMMATCVWLEASA